MALTISRERGASYPVGGGRMFHPCTITPDSSYAAGGEDISAASFGQRVGRIENIIQAGGDAETNGLSLSYNSTTGKVKFSRGAQSRAVAFGGGDIKGATNLAGTEGNADQNAAPVNAGLYKAATLVSTLAGTITPTTQPAVPRNVVITVTNDSGGALNLYEGVTTFTITGTDVNGAAQTETVTLTSTSGNKSVANSKFRFVQGVKAFNTITSITYGNAPATTLKMGAGPGTRMGLPTKLMNAAHTDVTVFSVNAAPVTISNTVANAGGVDTTNNTVNSGTTADGDDVYVVYKDSGEVGAGEDISGAVFKAIVVTK